MPSVAAVEPAPIGSSDTGELERLRACAPFAAMDAAALAFLAAHALREEHAAGTEILAPSQAGASLRIVTRGVVHATQSRAYELVEEPYPTLETGAMFPLAAVVAGVECTATYRALEPTVCLALGAADVRSLLALSPAFLAHAMERLARLVRHARAAALAEKTHLTSEQQSMGAPLRALVRTAPVTCTTATSLRAALSAMRAAGVGSMVVTGDDGAPVGIFTLQDLLNRVVLDGVPLDAAIETVMTREPLSLPADASAYDAALLMAHHRARHVPVLEEGKVIGLVSQRDLFSAQRVTLRQLPETIAAATDIAELEQAARDIRELAREMLVNGVAAERLTLFIAALNDRLSHRLIDIELVRHRLEGMRLCWIALGSEGRLEQTLSTDQDNGLIFEAQGLAADEARARLLPFAQAVNAALDRCGFPLCKGGIMAGNPSWCLSLAEWERQFSSWMRNPDPQALLNSTVFFDFRAVFGDETLAARLRAWLVGSTEATPLFLHHMAGGALSTPPPLGFFRDFRYDKPKEYPHTIDLKLYGLRPFVEAARIYALQLGIAHTNTGQRLRLAAPRLRMSADEVEALVGSFYFIQMLRLRHQQFDADAAQLPNRIDPMRLNELDRVILKEAFRQARNLQTRLALDYPR